MKAPWYFGWFTALLAWLTFVSPTALPGQQLLGPERPTTLTNLREVSSLSLEEGAKAWSVKARGVITYYDRERGLLMLQEESSGVSVRLPNAREGIMDFEPHPGQQVEVEGQTARGRTRPLIRPKALHLVGKTQMPAPYKIKAEAPIQAQADGRWVHVRGWIATVTRAGGKLSSEVIVRAGQSLEFTLNGGDSPEANELAGSQVELFGVYSLKYDGAGQINGARIYVNDLASIKKTSSVAIAAIADVGATAGKAKASEPFRVRATVVNHSLGEFLIVRDNSGSLRVPYRGLNYFVSGSLVEVFGFPVQQRPELVLTNIIVRLVPADASNEEPVTTIITPSAPNTNLTTLSHVMQIRKLPPNEASRGYPVRVVGIITFCDLGSYLHFVQDETSGIYLDLSRVENPSRLHSGLKVEIQGFSGPGDYAPVLLAQSVRILGEEPLPAPEMVTFRKLMRGNFDSQWVSLKGVVRNQWITTNSSTLALFTGDGIIKAIIPGVVAEFSGVNLVDSAVEVQAVCRTIFDDHRRLQAVELQVPGWKRLRVHEPATADPFKQPVRAVNELFQFHADGSELHRAHLVGVVTLRSRDGSFYVQDGSGGIQVQPGPTNASVQIGTTVEAVGFPVIVDQLAMLQDAQVHPLKDFTQVEPAELKAEAPLEDTLQATLVKLEGEVLGHFSHWSEEVLTVRLGQRIIDAVLQRDNRPEQLASIAPGTIIRLSGVLVGQADSAGAIQSFRVMLRSTEDVRVIARPAWWTLRHTLWTVAGLATVLLLALGWVRALRRQVHQRTVELHEEIEHHKRTEAKLEAEIAERKRMETEIERSHQELLIASRQAGMAEVATSVLHNVGNVLNSVNVSAGVVAEKIRRSKVHNISRAAEMMKENAADLGRFLEQDPKGRQLPEYLGRLAEHLNAEQGAILRELESLRKNVEHIKGIVGMQQNYAKVFGSAEPANPTELVEDALRMHNGALVRHEVRVVREYQDNLPQIVVDKHKLLQILVNLICNAKNACDDSVQAEKVVTVGVVRSEDRIKISVTDNGVGIAPENLTRIFNHGFTTRKDGHGFGLHSGALAAREMGGALVAQSEGRGKGASFTVDLPINCKGADKAATTE